MGGAKFVVDVVVVVKTRAFVCSKTKHLLLRVFVCFVCDVRKNVSICTKT